MAMNIIKESFMSKFNMSNLNIKSRTLTNLEKQIEEQGYQMDSPCLKREPSLASTISSPYTRSYKSEEEELEQIPDIFSQKTCSNFIEKGYCMNGLECNFIHEHYQQENKYVKDSFRIKSTIIQNFPELLISFQNKKIRLFCH